MNGLFSQPLNVEQAYQLGRYAAYMENWFYTSDWMKVTLDVMHKIPNEKTHLNEFFVLELLAFSEYEVCILN